MSTVAEKNQFRRLVGDYPAGSVDDATVESYLNDAVAELTADFTDASGVSAPVTVFDALVKEYHPEVILWGAINWWWNRLAILADRHSQTVGDAAQSISEKWDRALAMIKELEVRYNTISALGTDISVGNFSRFSKQSLLRLGGNREEEEIKEIQGED